MKDFQIVVNQLERNQKLYHIITGVGIAALTLLWCIDISQNLKSDRPSSQEVSDRLLHPQVKE